MRNVAGSAENMTDPVACTHGDTETVVFHRQPYCELRVQPCTQIVRVLMGAGGNARASRGNRRHCLQPRSRVRGRGTDRFPPHDPMHECREDSHNHCGVRTVTAGSSTMTLGTSFGWRKISFNMVRVSVAPASRGVEVAT